MNNIKELLVVILGILGFSAITWKWLDTSAERAKVKAEANERMQVLQYEEAEKSHQRKLKETAERMANEAKKAEQEIRKQEELYSKFDTAQIFELEKIRLETEKVRIEANAEVDKIKAESNAELEKVKTEAKAEVDKVKAAAEAKKDENYQKRYIIENGIDAASTILLKNR